MFLEVSQESQMWVSCFCNIRILPSDSRGGFSVCCRVSVKKGIRDCWEAAFQIICLTGSAHFVSAAQIPVIGKRRTLSLCVCVRTACSDSRHGFFHTLRGWTYHLVTSSLALEDSRPKGCLSSSPVMYYLLWVQWERHSCTPCMEWGVIYAQQGAVEAKAAGPLDAQKSFSGYRDSGKQPALKDFLFWRVLTVLHEVVVSPTHSELVKWKNEEKESEVSPGLPRDLPCKGPHHL